MKKLIINNVVLCGLTISLVSYGAHNSCASDKTDKSTGNQKHGKSLAGTPRSTIGAGYSSGNTPNGSHSSKKKASQQSSGSANSSVQSSPRSANSGSLTSLKGAPPLTNIKHTEEKEAVAQNDKEALSHATHYARLFFTTIEPTEKITAEIIEKARDYVKIKAGIKASSKSLWLHAAQWQTNLYKFKSHVHNTEVATLTSAAKEYEELANKSQPDGVDVPLE